MPGTLGTEIAKSLIARRTYLDNARPHEVLRHRFRRLFFSTLLFCAALFAQPTPNIDGNYQQLRNTGLQTRGISVEKVTRKRDAATFRFNSGAVCFVIAVNNISHGRSIRGRREGSFL